MRATLEFGETEYAALHTALSYYRRDVADTIPNAARDHWLTVTDGLLAKLRRAGVCFPLPVDTDSEDY